MVTVVKKFDSRFSLIPLFTHQPPAPVVKTPLWSCTRTHTHRRTFGLAQKSLLFLPAGSRTPAERSAEARNKKVQASNRGRIVVLIFSLGGIKPLKLKACRTLRKKDRRRKFYTRTLISIFIEILDGHASLPLSLLSFLFSSSLCLLSSTFLFFLFFFVDLVFGELCRPE